MAKNDLEALERELTRIVPSDKKMSQKADTMPRRMKSPPPQTQSLDDDYDDGGADVNEPQNSQSVTKKYTMRPPQSLSSKRYLDDGDDNDMKDDLSFDDDPLPPDNDDSKSGPNLLLILAIAGLVVVGGLALWFVYNQGVISGSETAAPTLRLDGPIKMQPDSPGNIAVSQNSELFERIDGIDDRNQTNQPVEASPPAQQNNADSVAVGQNTTTPPPPSITAPEPEAEPALTVGDAPPQSQVAVPQTVVEAVPENAVSQAVNQADEVVQDSFTPPATQASTEQANSQTPAILQEANQVEDPPEGNIPASGTGWRIQIAALPSLEEARSFWQTTRGRFPGVLNSLSFSTEVVSVNDQQYHRVRGGPLPNRQTAERVCDTLVAQGQACIIVRP